MRLLALYYNNEDKPGNNFTRIDAQNHAPVGERRCSSLCCT